MVSWCFSSFKIKHVWELKEIISNTYVVSYKIYKLCEEMYGRKVYSASGFSLQLNSLY